MVHEDGHSFRSLNKYAKLWRGYVVYVQYVFAHEEIIEVGGRWQRLGGDGGCQELQYQMFTGGVRYVPRQRPCL